MTNRLSATIFGKPARFPRLMLLHVSQGTVCTYKEDWQPIVKVKKGKAVLHLRDVHIPVTLEMSGKAVRRPTGSKPPQTNK